MTTAQKRHARGAIGATGQLGSFWCDQSTIGAVPDAWHEEDGLTIHVSLFAHYCLGGEHLVGLLVANKYEENVGCLRLEPDTARALAHAMLVAADRADKFAEDAKSS